MLFNELYNHERQNKLSTVILIGRYRNYSEFYDYVSLENVQLTTEEYNQIESDKILSDKMLKVLKSSISDICDDYEDADRFYPDDYWEDSFHESHWYDDEY